MEIPIRFDIEVIKELAAEGDVSSQRKLAASYSLQNQRELALHWYVKAARQKDAEAIYRISRYVKNPKKRFKWILKGAQGGSDIAQWNLGSLYEFGCPLKKTEIEIDPKKALYWYLKSAKQNFPDALFSIASYYENKGNYKKAVEYYSKAHSCFLEDYYKLTNAYLLETGKIFMDERS